MWKLIKLEYKKNNVSKYVRNAVILTVLLGIFIFAMAFLGIANDAETGKLDATPGNDVISASVEMLTGMAFLIFTCVMLASFIVSAYKNKTMNLMFSYPIKRQKLLLSQMLSVWIFNFAALSIAKFLIYLSLYLGSRFMESSFVIDFNIFSVSFYVQLLLKSVTIVTMSFIALFIGLAMKSSKAVIVSSFLLIFLTQANVGDFTLADNSVFPILIVIVSVLFAGLSICRAERRDLN